MAEDQDRSRRQSVVPEHPIRDAQGVQFLNDEEIEKFIDDLDHNDDGYIDYDEVEQKLDAAHDELAPNPAAHHVLKRDHDSHDDRVRHAFLRNMMGSSTQRIPRAEFADLVRSWKIPSLQQAKKAESDENKYFKTLSSWRRIRAIWAVHGPEIVFVGIVVCMSLAFGIWQLVKYYTETQYRAAFGWGVVMSKTCAGTLYTIFFFILLSMSRYFSTFMRKFYYVSRLFNWDLSQEFHIRISCAGVFLATLHAIGHLTGSFVHGSRPQNEDAVANVIGEDMVPRDYVDFVRTLPGWTGITALGCLYILSLLSLPQVRRWNYEVFQLGHLLMFPIIGLMMAHGVLALLQWPMFGYFLAFPTLLVLIERITRISLGFHHIEARMRVLDADTVEITATIPSQRLWRYKAGQYIFLQVPAISFFQWHPFTVSLCVGNKMQVHIKTDGDWTSKLRDLGGESGVSDIKIGVNGPFGAPAQRFYDFNHTVIIGAGIGVTPFSGILADLQAHDDMAHGGPGHFKVDHRPVSAAPSTLDKNGSEDELGAGPEGGQGEGETKRESEGEGEAEAQTEADTATDAAAKDGTNQNADNTEKTNEKDVNGTNGDDINVNGDSDYNNNNHNNANGGNVLSGAPNRHSSVGANLLSKERAPQPHLSHEFADDYRRVDFHWMVRERNYLHWLSDLLNEVSLSQEWHRDHEPQPHLDIRMQTHVTAKQNNIVTHVYRWLLEMHRTEEHPASPLTGLLNPTHFGRPDFDRILDEHYDEVRKFRASKRLGKAATEGAVDVDYKESDELKVGVFYCGAPVVGEILADKCQELTSRGRHDGSKIEYHFMMEVFG